MNQKSKLFVFMMFLLLVFAGVMLAFFSGRVPHEQSIFNNNIVDSVSFIIALAAFVFSAITFFSIDSVNGITSMNGNVLENEHYSITYPSAIKQFNDSISQEEYTKCLFDIVYPKHRSTTCIVFADQLQRIIDNLVWFNYVDMNSEYVKKNCKKLLHYLDREMMKYNKLSNGINYLFNENIKLIRYVLDYQKYRYSGDIQICDLEDVRGEMFLNPISRIVYYNYLGLDYRRQAGRIIDLDNLRMPEFSVKNMKRIRMNIAEERYTEDQIDKIFVLLERAEKCFKRAYNVAEGNLIWEGSIMLNLTRVHATRFLLGADVKYESVLKEFDGVIAKRNEEKLLFFTDSDNSFLCQRYHLRRKHVIDEKKNLMLLVEEDYKDEKTE